MSTPLVQNRETVIVPAGQSKTVYPVSDYVQYQAVPTGLRVGINGGQSQAVQQATILQGVPGERQIQSLLFENTTGGELTAIVVHGTGSMTVSGEAVITGALPLPTGAATAAKQDVEAALLTTLAGVVTETPDMVTLTNASQAFANRRTLSVTNTGSANITVNGGAGARTLAPGDSVEWAVSGPFNKLASVTVDATGSTAIVTSTL